MIEKLNVQIEGMSERLKTERERYAKEENDNSGFEDFVQEDVILGGQGAKGTNALIENIQDSLNQNENDTQVKEIIELYSGANADIKKFINMLL